MSKNSIIWLTEAIAFNLLIVFLVVYSVNSIIERAKEKYASKTFLITLIAEAELSIQERNQEAYQQRIQQWREQQRDQNQKYQDIRRQQQERFQRQNDFKRQQQERILTPEKLIQQPKET